MTTAPAELHTALTAWAAGVHPGEAAPDLLIGSRQGDTGGTQVAKGAGHGTARMSMPSAVTLRRSPGVGYPGRVTPQVLFGGSRTPGASVCPGA